MSTDLSPTLQDWIGALTAAGFDIINTNGNTSRGDWNINHPIPQLVFLFSRSPDIKGKPCDVVIKAYACNSNQWRVYAMLHTGKAKTKRWGMIVTGSKETTLDFTQIPTLSGQ